MAFRLPAAPDGLMATQWTDLSPRYDELLSRPLDADTIHQWLADWSLLSEAVGEMSTRLGVAADADTADAEAERALLAFVRETLRNSEAKSNALAARLLASDLCPPGFEEPLRRLRASDEIFTEANLPLLADERELETHTSKILGSRTVSLDGEERTIPQLQPLLESHDRARREEVWRLSEARQLDDREALNDLWVRFYSLRQEIAANAGLSDYRAYVWKGAWRFDYTPQDCEAFGRAILDVAVPAAARVYERRRARLGVPTLRPWDLAVDPYGEEPLRPLTAVADLEDIVSGIVGHVDPVLQGCFETMRAGGLLDLGNRKNKAPGAYSASLPMSKRPCIFMNAVGHHEDVEVLIHELGHACHAFLSADLPLVHLRQVPMEFCEVASMGLVYLACPYFQRERGGCYSAREAARATIAAIERALLFWPYMAVVDGFQHWAYLHPDDASQPARCDEAWAELFTRFTPGVDYSGLDATLATGWQRKPHIFGSPFYYVEYGLAQLGAVQLWRLSQSDSEGAAAAYRRALSLGGSVPLPELFAAAGARFEFDAGTLREAVGFLEEAIEALLPLT